MRGMERQRIGRTALSTGAAVLLLLGSGPAAGQQGSLTLREALARGDRGAYANRMAEGEARVQAGEGRRALRGILPTVRLEGGYGRTTDPIGAFGITLRQRAITQQDFDPALLNDPAARTNYTGAVVVEQPLVNADAWLGRRAAAYATAAREAAAQWTSLETRVSVVGAYFGSVLAHAQVRTLEEAHEAARGHVRQAESLVKQGMVTRSDALLAQVKAGEIETQLIEARGAASLVKRQLALLLGTPDDTSFALPEELPAAKRVFALDDAVVQPAAGSVADAGAEVRADVRAARSAHAASRADVRRARSLWLPRLNGVARYDWNSPDAPFGGRENWSVGVMASWTPFAGGGQLADLRAASGREEVSRAQAEAARAQAELDVAARSNAWAVALERLRIAGDAVAQSVEAHRIVTRKYEGGLATVVELLAASAAETEAQLREAHARYDAVLRAAELLQSVGRDPALLSDWAVDS
ncbi:MAG TPA: TolC family protein [Longimicrobiales bacterium]